MLFNEKQDADQHECIAEEWSALPDILTKRSQLIPGVCPIARSAEIINYLSNRVVKNEWKDIEQCSSQS